MRLVRIPSLLARASRRATGRGVAAASILSVAALLGSSLPAAALTEGGTITVSGEGTTSSSYPCVGCTINFSVVTSSGDVSGVDTSNNPFTVSWDAPGASSAAFSLFISADCGIPDAPPTITDLSGTLNVSGGVLVYRGVQMPASVTATFNASQIEDSAITVHGLTVTATSGSVSVSVTVAVTGGVLNLVPLGDDLCPNLAQMKFAASGTLLSAL